MITKSPFKPLWYLRNPHMQTILGSIIHPKTPAITMETVELPDGDRLQLARGTARDADTVLVLHGLEGSVKSAYAQRLMNRLNRENIAAAIMLFRGCDGRANNKTRSYHSGETGDLSAVIQHLKNSGSRRIALVGYSLGGNVTLKYMGENTTDEAIICASAISVPLLLDVCADTMDRGFAKIYQHSLLKRLKRKVLQKEQLLIEGGYNTNLKAIKNFVQFDDQFTAPIHGFENARHYYQSCSSRQFLKHIHKPTLIIHSKDDPFMTRAVIPENVELSNTTTLELSQHGGHVGFIAGGLLKPEFWLEQRIIRFLKEHFLSHQTRY